MDTGRKAIGILDIGAPGDTQTFTTHFQLERGSVPNPYGTRTLAGEMGKAGTHAEHLM